MKKYFSLEELKNDLKWNIFDYIRYFCFYIWWNPLLELRYTVPNFFERAYYGVGNRDVWDFDHYLCTVIIRGLKTLQNNAHGIPTTLMKKLTLTEQEKDVMGFRVWKDQLQIMIDGFEAHIKIYDMEYKSQEELKKLQKQFRKGFILFVRHFGSLWD